MLRQRAWHLGALLLVVQQMQAQFTCVPEVDVMDPFTKVRTISVSSPGTRKGPGLRWRSENQVWSLELNWTVVSTEQIAVLERDTLLLMLENDSVVPMPSARTEVAQRQVDPQGRVLMTGTYTYLATPAQARLLSKYWVTRLRLYHSNGFLEFGSSDDILWQQNLEVLTTCFVHTCNTTPPARDPMVSQKIEVPLPGR